MKHPVWILNSALLVLIIIVFGFMIVSRQRVPSRESIEPELYAKTIKQDASIINISKIYENDLFNTYIKPAEQPVPESVTFAFPTPPAPKKTEIPKDKDPEFLDPLKITLRGIIIVQNDDSKNKAIIADNKTMQEANYKVGDSIDGSQLIRVFPTKVVFLRSNGQQEVLYLREKDAILDPVYAAASEWDKIIQRVADNNFLLNPTEFSMTIKNLAQFIDNLDMVAVYEKGKSVGTRIGRLEEKSIGVALGLQTGDIILSINNIPTTDTPNRVKIYKDVTTAELDSTITVKLLRNKEETIFRYTLKDFKKNAAPQAAAPNAAPSTDQDKEKERIRQEQLTILQQKYKFAPTAQEIKKQTKETMRNHGRAPLGATSIADE